jgi:hypothetical protein
MRIIAFLTISSVAAVAADAASAQTSQTRRYPQPQVIRSASGTVIQPTRTIIHNPDGSTTVITVPRRSYLNPGTEVPVGYGSRMDYAFPPGGDPGRPYSFYGPDLAGVGGLPLAQPFLVPGFNPNNPY